jgi:hypothetical protein
VRDCPVIEQHPAAEHNHRRLMPAHKLAKGALRDLHLGGSLGVGPKGHGASMFR